MAQSLTTPFTTDPTDEIPVGVQLGWRLRALIRSGRLGQGERMPSVRTLAGLGGGQRQHRPRRLLAARGRRARSTPGTAPAASSPPAPAARPRSSGSRARRSRAPREAGVDAARGGDRHARRGLAAELPPLDPAVPADADAGDAPLELSLADLAAELDIDDSWLEADEVGARQELRRQIGRLEAQLASYTVDLESLAGDAPPRVRAAEPRIASAADLERTRDELLHRLADCARGGGATRPGRGAGARGPRRDRRRPGRPPAGRRSRPQRPVRTAAPTWESSPQMGPFGALMRWWRVRVSGGCP